MAQPLLPLPVAADDIAAWDKVCLVELWQPAATVRNAVALTPNYTRRLFAAPDWETLWPTVDRCSLHDDYRRPSAITRYECAGARAHLLIETVQLGLQLPRLYAIDGIIKPCVLQQDDPHVGLPLVSGNGTLVKRNWPTIRRVWQEHDENNLRGIGLIVIDRGSIAIQPIPHDCHYMDRVFWQMAAISKGNLQSDAAERFYKSPVLTEAALVKPVAPDTWRPDFQLNKGFIARLRLKARKDGLVPKSKIVGTTMDRHRPHPTKLVIIPGRSPA